ncbi:MAG: response regulator transcription factor, partial [Acidimicrobiales bacterium]|nr:response regulator transcription factor [Acidimicrobiales bacterium]
LMLPGMNGYRVCKAIRDAEVWTPILMLTAKSGEFDEVEGLDTGADDYLVKPVSSAVLIARVRALLRRPRRRVDWPTIAGIRLDPLHRRCLVEGSYVALTSRETEVLGYLLDHPDETIPRGQLLEAVWGPDFVGDPNIVEVYISHLRRKLDEPFGRTALETVRGEGYRLRSLVDQP